MIDQLNKILEEIKKLDDYDHFTHDLFVQMFFANMKIMKAHFDRENIDVESILTFFTEYLNISLEDIVMGVINRRETLNIIENKLENMSEDELNLSDLIVHSCDGIKAKKSVNFDDFINNINIGNLSGNK